MPSHCWSKPCVFTSSQLPSEARLSHCPYCHTHIPLSPTENSWDYVSWTKNAFPSFSGLPQGYLRTQLDSAILSPKLRISSMLSGKGRNMGSVSSYWAGSWGNSPVTSFFYFEVRKTVVMLHIGESVDPRTECCIWVKNLGGRTKFEESPSVLSNLSIKSLEDWRGPQTHTNTHTHGCSS